MHSRLIGFAFAASLVSSCITINKNSSSVSENVLKSAGVEYGRFFDFGEFYYFESNNSLLRFKVKEETVYYVSPTNGNLVPVGQAETRTGRPFLLSLCSNGYREICRVQTTKRSLLEILFKPQELRSWVKKQKVDLLSKPLCNPLICCNQPDGCSSLSDNPKQIRDSVAGISLKPACDAHDQCYYLGEKSAGGCNGDFFDDLNKICRDKSKVVVGGVKGVNPIKLATCTAYATVLYAGVVTGQAFPIYKEAREKQINYETKNNCVSVQPSPPIPEPQPDCFLAGGAPGKHCFIPNLSRPCCCPTQRPNCCERRMECGGDPL